MATKVNFYENYGQVSEGEGRADLFQLLFLPGNHRGLQDEIDLRDQG